MILDWLAQDFIDLFACDSRARITFWCNTKADFKACFTLLGPCSGILKFGKQVVTATVALPLDPSWSDDETVAVEVSAEDPVVPRLATAHLTNALPS